MTQQLLWRATHGEVPRSLRDLPGTTFVVLAGTSNLGNGMEPVATAKGAVAVADLLLELTHSTSKVRFSFAKSIF